LLRLDNRACVRSALDGDAMKPARPLTGHRFHSLCDESLHYITKDAAEAAQAMRDHDAKAEAKYLDQVNDAATILAWRRSYRAA
jgi:hypothetical protein